MDDAQARARTLCRTVGVQAMPYGGAWWLLGSGVNKVVGDLAGLTLSDIVPLPLFER